MCNWKRWIWPGIIASVLLTVLALLFMSGSIERDLTSRAGSTLEAAGLEWNELTIDGRDLTVGGLAFSEAEQSRAVDLATSEYGVRVVDDATSLVPPQRPYTFAIDRAGNEVTLTGFVPSEAARADVVSAVETVVPDAQINDQLRLGRGAPDGFSDLSGFTIAQLAGLDDGQLELSDTQLTASGLAINDAAYTTVLGALDGTLPGEGTLGSRNIRPPFVDPYAIAIERTTEAVRLRGFVPSDEARADIVATAEETFPGAVIDDALQLASGQPDGWSEAVAFTLDQMGGLSVGAASIEGTTASIEGIARTQTDFDAINSNFGQAITNGFEVGNVSIEPPIVDPYFTTIQRSADGVTITGFMPNVAAQADLATQLSAIFPDLEVQDRTRLASGAPEGHAAAVSFGAEQLAGLQPGVATVDGSELSIRGTALTNDTFSGVQTAYANAIPDGFSVGGVRVAAPVADPYLLTITKDAQRVELAGVVPSEEASAGLADRASAAAPEADVIDNTSLASGAPAGFALGADFATDQLSGLSEGTMTLDGRVLSAQGVANSSESYERILSALADDRPSAISLGSVDIVPPAEASYSFSAQASDGQVVLTGEVPDADTRASLAGRAAEQFPDAEIVDRLRFASGAPDAYEQQAAFSLSQLTSVEDGAAGFTPDGFFMRGRASSLDAYDSAINALAADLPGGMAVAENGVTPPVVSPYLWSATKVADGIVLDGFVPSEDVRGALVAQAGEQGGSVTDNLRLAAGAADGFQQAAEFGLTQLSQLESGSASLTDSDYSINGQAGDSASFEAESAAALVPPEGFATANAAISPPAVPDYPFQASLADNTVTLTGFAPSEAARTEAGEAASERFPDATIVNELQIGAGAPAAYDAGVGRALELVARFDDGEAGFEGSAFSASGTAKSVTDFPAANALANSLPTGFGAGDIAISPANVSPYSVTLVRNPETVTLTGFAPDSNAVAAAEDAVATAMPDVAIVNRLQVAGGLPEGVAFDGAMIFATDQLAQLETGTVTLSDANYAVSGVAQSVDSFDSVTGALENALPAGLALASPDVRLPVVSPYVWSVRRDGDRVALSGNVPSTEEADRLIGFAQTRFSGLDVSSDMRRAGGEPRNFDSAASVGLTTLSRMRSGFARLEGTQLTVEGETFSPSLRDDLTAAISNRLPAGYTGVANLTAPELAPVAANQCDSLIAERMSEASIGFETAKAVIRPDSFGLLDELSGIVARCPGTRIEIDGHTDSDGSETYNQRLSEARANAVRTYMVEAGVEALRIRARGFGETQPIADNATDEGKAVNRRIEFSIVE